MNTELVLSLSLTTDFLVPELSPELSPGLSVGLAAQYDMSSFDSADNVWRDKSGNGKDSQPIVGVSTITNDAGSGGLLNAGLL